jgi:hypothetical protein
MTEQEWLSCTDPHVLLVFLHNKITARKLRLFAVACCRMIAPQVKTEGFHRLVDIAEQCADQQVPLTVIGDAVNLLYQQTRTADEDNESRIYRAAREIASPVQGIREIVELMQAIWWFSDQSGAAIHRLECSVLRDISGNPFRPATLVPAWRTASVQTHAQVIYDQRAFDRLPILADALEEAGYNFAGP